MEGRLFVLGRRGLELLALSSLLLGMAFVGTGSARGGDRLHVSVASRVKVGTHYQVAARGYATRADRLYVFVDYTACGRNPQAEVSHGAPGLYFSVHGGFSKVIKDWVSRLKAPDHACAYLTHNGRVAARAFSRYTIY